MAVSQRTRYHALRRCNFACYYCGVPAPVVQLQVDHVIPRAFGGGDNLWNLVAACQDCNNGKTDTVPDLALIQRVRDETAAYWAAMELHVFRCDVCGIPVRAEDQDLAHGEEVPTRCDVCDDVVVYAFDAGVRHTRGLPARRRRADGTYR